MYPGETSEGAWALNAVRVAALLVAVFQIPLVITHYQHHGRATYVYVGVHGLNLVLAPMAFALTYARPMQKHWRALVLLGSIYLIIGAVVLSALDGEPDFLLVTVTLVVMGTGALIPWRPAWQAALSLSALGAMSLAYGTPILAGASTPLRFALHWAGVLSAVGAGHFAALLGSRYRSELGAQLKAITESEERFRAIFEASPDPAAIARLSDGKVIKVNEEFERVLGVTCEVAAGHAFVELGLLADPPPKKLLHEEVREHGKVRGRQVKLRIRGQIRTHLLSAAAVRIGGEDCMVTIGRDISELKEAEQRIEESRAVLRKTFDSLLDPLLVADLSEGRCVDVNDEFLRLTGYDREEVIGHTYWDLDLWVDSAPERNFIDSLKAKGAIRNHEITFRRHDGALVPALLSAVALELGGRQCVIATARDITQLKQTESALEVAREVALAASSAKSEFLSSMSHEIRTPMNAILGMADLLNETALDPQQRRCLDTIVSNGDALLNLINGILDLARIESGRLSLEAVEFDVAEIAEQVADTLAVRAHEKGIELALRLAPGVPAVVIGDPLRLRQVLTNLVGNAIKFTEEGEVTVTVACGPEQTAPGSVLFSVADTGIGIPQDKLATIFSAFAQADSSVTRRFGGTGLGLAIVERLVGLMGGRVWVESEPDKGSTFYFTAQFGVPAAPRLVRPAPELDVAGTRVLVVDDNATNRLILREMLGPTGAVVSESASALEGLDAIEEARRAERPFRLLIVDYRMPGMDGLEMVQRVRQSASEKDLVVMMLTSTEIGARLNRIKEMGLDHYVVKPVKRRELYAAIARTMAAAQEAPSEATPSRQAAEPRILDRALRILLVDDSSDNRFLIRAYLKRTPYVVDEAENGQIGLDKFIAGHYDAVLMDVQMPVLDGYRATRAIRQWERDNGRRPTPVIALTASVLDDAVRRATEAGCDLHVAKPVKKAILLEAIALVVGGYEAAAMANEAKR